MGGEGPTSGVPSAPNGVPSAANWGELPTYGAVRGPDSQPRFWAHVGWCGMVVVVVVVVVMVVVVVVVVVVLVVVVVVVVE